MRWKQTACWYGSRQRLRQPLLYPHPSLHCLVINIWRRESRQCCLCFFNEKRFAKTINFPHPLSLQLTRSHSMPRACSIVWRAEWVTGGSNIKSSFNFISYKICPSELVTLLDTLFPPYLDVVYVSSHDPGNSFSFLSLRVCILFNGKAGIEQLHHLTMNSEYTLIINLQIRLWIEVSNVTSNTMRKSILTGNGYSCLLRLWIEKSKNSKEKQKDYYREK